MTLTPERKLQITRWLAEEVMGWTEWDGMYKQAHLQPAGTYSIHEPVKSDKRVRINHPMWSWPRDWDPLKEANAALEVLSKVGDDVLIQHEGRDQFMGYWLKAFPSPTRGSQWVPATDEMSTLMTAVCLAAYRATGGATT